MDVVPYGRDAWLLADIDDPAGIRAAVLDAFAGRVEDVVAAERSVVVRFPVGDGRGVEDVLGSLAARPVDATADEIEIPVIYDGADLEAVAIAAGLAVEEAIALHSGAEYRVAFCGFSPGFAYLVGLDAALHLPRRPEPRTSVPAGSVAIAAHYSAVYPTASPGGWHLIGSTAVDVWDAAREPPALLTPGTRLRFVPQEG